MPIYDKPTKTLMKQFADEKLIKGRAFMPRDAVQWFAEKYPKINSGTVKIHVEAMAINNLASRKHYPNIRPGSGHDLFFKIAPGQFRLWEKRKRYPACIWRR